MNFSDLSLINVQTPLIVSNGLIGYWPLNDGSGLIARDFSGNRKDGIVMTGPSWTNGRIGPGMYFTGSGLATGHVAVSIASQVAYPNIPTGSAARTICLWFKMRVNKEMEFLGYGANLLNQRWGMYWSKDNSAMYMEMAGTTRGVVWTWTSDWTHFVTCMPAGQTDISALKMWINNVSQTLAGNTGTLNTVVGGNVLMFGGLPVGTDSNPPQQCDAIIDDVRIYNRELTTDEITKIYNARGT